MSLKDMTLWQWSWTCSQNTCPDCRLLHLCEVSGCLDAANWDFRGMENMTLGDLAELCKEAPPLCYGCRVADFCDRTGWRLPPRKWFREET